MLAKPHFKVKGIKQFREPIEIRSKELPELIPDELGKVVNKVVLDGFCNPIESQSFSLEGTAVYLKAYHRRRKVTEKDQHYSNSYSVHPEGR